MITMLGTSTSERDLALLWSNMKPGDQFMGSKLPNVPVSVYQLLKHKPGHRINYNGKHYTGLYAKERKQYGQL